MSETETKLKGNNAARRQFKITERQQQVFDLWKEGATYRAIGKVLKKKAEDSGESTRGFSHTQIMNDIKHVLYVNKKEFDLDVSDFKELQLARLNDQYMTFNSLAKGKVDIATGVRSAPDPYAGRLVLGVLKEISEITGVRSAVKHEIAPIQMMHTMSAIDLSSLSKEELLQYESLLKKANANGVQG